MYSLISVILLSIYLYLKKERSSSSDEPYIMKKNIIKFYSYYYITSALHKIKTTIKFYLNLFFIIFHYILFLSLKWRKAHQMMSRIL